MKGLVRVKSESELRPGMTVWNSECIWCGRKHVHVLLRRCKPVPCEHDGGEEFIHAGWATAQGSFHSPCPTVCMIDPIDRGTLYRLPDDEQPAETTRSRVRERETT